MNLNVWLIDDEITITGTGACVPTPPYRGLRELLDQLAARIATQDRNTGTLLLTDSTAGRHGLLSRAADVRTGLGKQGWLTTGSGHWFTAYNPAGINVHVGLVDALDRDEWVFGGPAVMWDQTCRSIQEWNDRTGHAWGHSPAVVGVSLIAAVMRPWRKEGVKGNLAVDKRDEHTHDSWAEHPYMLGVWGRRDPGHPKWLHGYDKVRAGLAAAGKAKCAVEKLTNGWRRFDPKRSGWWQIETPAWNMKELPHPIGPDAKPGQLRWVTTATLDLVADLANEGVMAFPDIIESWTAPGRPVLRPFSDLLESVYQESRNPLVREAVKETANAGIGMLGNPDGSCYRADWLHAVQGTKRANIWRAAWRVGNAHGRYPVTIDDDKLWYSSNEKDPIAAAPGMLSLTDDRSGFRPETTVESGE